MNNCVVESPMKSLLRASCFLFRHPVVRVLPWILAVMACLPCELSAAPVGDGEITSDGGGKSTAAMPRVGDDAYEATPNAVFFVPAPGVLVNDLDAATEERRVVVVAGPSHGLLALGEDGSFTYLPYPEYRGTDSFTYRVSGGRELSRIARVTIKVAAPSEPSSSAVTDYAVVSGGVLEVSDSLSPRQATGKGPSLLRGPGHGSVDLHEDGSFKYQPQAEFIGMDSFVYKPQTDNDAREALTIRITVTERWKAIPELSRWEADMASFGTLHGRRFLDGTYDFAYTYYDAQRVYLQIAEYTCEDSWIQIADRAGELYRDQYVAQAKAYGGGYGAVPGYWNFTHGLAEHYLETGDDRSKSAVVALAQHAAYASDATPTDRTVSCDLSREVAYALMSYINAERVGEKPRHRVRLLVEQALGHCDQWFVDEADPVFAPFMFALTAESLILYWDWVEHDPRILARLQRGADWIWVNAWIPQEESFYYRANESKGAPDLNLLIAPVFGWLYLQTGDTKYRDRGDSVFAGGVRRAWLNGYKQFNQNYRWSLDYVKYRNVLKVPSRPVRDLTEATVR